MALDKQKILNELGNVVNQLQSADCGCMGKLFNQGNPNGMATPAYNGCMQSCCHGGGYGCQGYNAPGAGEPYAGNQHCMGRCNPPKLYADTYSYLNQNLMQPIVQEVYDDLKSMTPENTMVNSPMAAQMGLAQGNNQNPAENGNMAGNMGNMNPNQMQGGMMGNMNSNQMQGGMMGHMNSNQMQGGVMGNMSPNQMQEGVMGNMNSNQMQGGVTGNASAMSNKHPVHPHLHFGNPNMSNANNLDTTQMNNQQQMMNMAGMGPQIVNMMKGAADARSANVPNQGGQQGGPMANSPQSPEMGMPSNMTGDGGQYNAGNMPPSYNPGQYAIEQDNAGGSIQNPTAQYMAQPHMYTGTNANAQGNSMTSNMAQMNPGSQQMQSMSAPPTQQQMSGHKPYGQHSAGIAKFNEMFPGVMQGGDLGFDPMAIAIQMNPANQQKAAMSTMQDLMMGKGKGIMNPAAAANMSQLNQLPINQVIGQQNMAPSPIQQQLRGENEGVPIQNNQVPQQPVYAALTGTPSMNQQQTLQQEIPQQQYQQQYQGQNRRQIDPNTRAVVTGSLPTVYEGSRDDPNARQEGIPPSQSAPKMYMDPIFPADTSRNVSSMHMSLKPARQYHYNTLGQPVEMMPGRLYRSEEFHLPQTLSPQPVPSKARSDPMRYSNVKCTISKTSLMGERAVGKNPSRTQLQHLYNQYKGSQSFTQPAQLNRQADNSGSYSEGRINVQQQQGNAPRHVPVEKVGGDTAANNAMNNIVYQERLPPGQIGDVPAANKPPVDAEKIPMKSNNVRNGLQDQTYTSYTTSAAWTFHGATPAPYSNMYRYRQRAS